MNREEQVRILIDYLKKENTGYASLADPVDYTGRKKTSKKSYECPLARARHIQEYTRSRMTCIKEEPEQKGS